MNIFGNLKELISEHHNFFLKILIYGYITFIIVGFIPIYRLFSYEDWTDWKIFTTFYGDIYEYEKMAQGRSGEVSAPYKYRVLIPFIWSIFLIFLPFEITILILKFFFLFGSNLLMDRYLNSLNFSDYYRLLGTIFLNISFAIIQVSFTPNLDLALLFFAILFMIGIVEDKPYLIGISSILGVITKESFLFLFPIYILYNYAELKISFKILIRDKILPKRKQIISLLFLLIAFIEFLAIRDFHFYVYNDVDLIQSGFPAYSRYLSLHTVFFVIIYIVFTFTILWIGPFGYQIHKWEKDVYYYLSFYGIFVIFMITLLSSRITRVSFFLIIIYLPIFLRFIRDFESYK